jgi:hypothetical protein
MVVVVAAWWVVLLSAVVVGAVSLEVEGDGVLSCSCSDGGDDDFSGSGRERADESVAV